MTCTSVRCLPSLRVHCPPEMYVFTKSCCKMGGVFKFLALHSHRLCNVRAGRPRRSCEEGALHFLYVMNPHKCRVKALLKPLVGGDEMRRGPAHVRRLQTRAPGCLTNSTWKCSGYGCVPDVVREC
ncbi:hypothetical protein E2C01_079151 [Portunus trituberculatus]|uniref:Uncharacterized protein n=1 Tax=Portunus trituberculatus TaxID=210409 RepID=A0A5B7IPV6_PORTR|nr:hypothetical protein [Portunus trituberculatus]